MRNYKRIPISQRIEGMIEKIPIAGCWLWTGGTRSTGYGIVRGENQKNESAHRASYECFVGPIPNGLMVLHRCDVPMCVNPAHLFLGTHQENMTDRNMKGRQARQCGESQGQAKLTLMQVEKIWAKQEWLKGDGVKLAKEYGVSEATISSIKHGSRWSECRK